MKLMTKIFCIILVPYYIFIFHESLLHPEAWVHAVTWLNWAANIVGILGLSIYAFSLKGPPPLFWRAGLLVMGFVYGGQAVKSFSLMDFNEAGSLTAVLNYFFIVGPCIAAVIYLSFFNKKRKRLHRTE